MTLAPEVARSPARPKAAASKVPPLENGDRLTRAEFERRYHAMPHVKKAELIEGIVYMPSPVRLTQHGEPHGAMAGWVFYYKSKVPTLRLGDNATSRLDLDNEPQPDVMLLLPEAAGGQARIDAEGYVVGAPELVIEIAASTASIDLNQKLHAYRRNGVREYVVWRFGDGEIDWFDLVDERFVRREPDERGRLASRVFPGLVLDVAAMIAIDAQKIVATVDEGCKTPEHAEFAKRLATVAAG